MVKAAGHTDLQGRVVAMDDLDKEELVVIKKLQKFVATDPTWPAYHNYWLAEVEKLYLPRGLGRRQIVETPVYRIGQDLGSRLGIAQGHTRRSDYRDELERLVLTRFRSRKEFCKATGLSEDMLSHVLAKRKHLAVDTLASALEKVGYGLHIAPLPGASAKA